MKRDTIKCPNCGHYIVGLAVDNALAQIACPNCYVVNDYIDYVVAFDERPIDPTSITE